MRNPAASVSERMNRTRQKTALFSIFLSHMARRRAPLDPRFRGDDTCFIERLYPFTYVLINRFIVIPNNSHSISQEEIAVIPAKAGIQHRVLTRSVVNIGRRHDKKARRGFTLVEMSIVLIIIGLIFMTLYPALTAMRIAQQQQTTQDRLQFLLRVTGAYVQANGCLPCPAPPDPSLFGNGFGYVNGSTTASACGTCLNAEGLPPFASLGLPASMAKDGWGRWIRMRIDPHLATYTVAPPTKTCTAADITAKKCASDQLDTSAKSFLCKANISTTLGAAPITITTVSGDTQKVAVLFLSHGANGYGAYKIDPLNAIFDARDVFAFPGTHAGAYEKENADEDQDFVDIPPTISATTPFDDSLVYLSRNALVSLSSNTSCQTVW